MARQKQRLADRKSKVTVRDVALRAGVSESTVSRIIRNQSLVADATRVHVMESVRALGYVPNRIAGSLASLDSRLIGVVIPSLSNIVFPEVLQGINAGLAGTDHQPVITVTDYDIDAEETAVRNILSWQPAAILVTGFEHTDATRRMLEQSGVRVVEMMDIDKRPIDAAVGMSHYGAGLAAGRHLLGKGYRRFGYVGIDWGTDNRALQRLAGLTAALDEARTRFQGREVANMRSSASLGKSLTADLLARVPDIDIIVYANDDMAVGGVFHCMARGMTLPDDIAIFGFNGLEIGRELPLPLSTVRSNRHLIGQRSVEVILSRPDRPAEVSIVDTGFEIFEGATA